MHAVCSPACSPAVSTLPVISLLFSTSQLSWPHMLILFKSEILSPSFLPSLSPPLLPLVFSPVLQVRRLPSDKSGGSQLRVPLPIPPPVPQAPVPQAPIPVPQAPPPVPPPPHTPMQPQPGPGCIQSGGGGVEGEPTVEQCGGGWTLHLPAESACSSSSLTGRWGGSVSMTTTVGGKCHLMSLTWGW